MSRSGKKIKIKGVTGAVSEKSDKQEANRKLRRKVKQKINCHDENLPELREVSNVYGFDKDGKYYDPKMKPKDLRK